jgi:hypothetical protein
MERALLLDRSDSGPIPDSGSFLQQLQDSRFNAAQQKQGKPAPAGTLHFDFPLAQAIRQANGDCVATTSGNHLVKMGTEFCCKCGAH